MRRGHVLPKSIFLAILLCLALCSFGQNQNDNDINTFAGGGSVNGPATGANADLAGPSAVAVDKNGNLYMAVPSANQIYAVVSNGATISVIAGLGWPTVNPTSLDGGPATSASLNHPMGVAVDTNGNLYIADTADNLIRKINTSGTISTVVGTGAPCANPTSPCGDNGPATKAQINTPYAIATDPAGNIYIADTGDVRVRAVNTTTSAVTIAGITIQPGNIATIAGNGVVCSKPTLSCGDGKAATAANLNSPQGVAVDKLGNIAISDTGDHRVRGVLPSGVIEDYIGNGQICVPSAGCGDGGTSTKANLTSPWQVYIDANDTVYVADAGANEVRQVVVSRQISRVAGTGTACSSTATPFCGDGGNAKVALLNSPQGIVLDKSGNIYIADRGDQRIRLVSSSKISTFAGGGSGNDGGPATSAILGGSRDTATDGAGNVYIADTANNRIRKISGGNISTVVGNGLAAYAGDGKAATSAALNSPYGVYVDSSNAIWITDTGNLVIRQVSGGTINTVAGNGQLCIPTTACGDGGPATKATLSMPVKAVTDSAGNLYIADAGAHRVRMVNPSGTISTIAGTGVACTTPASGSCGDGGPASAAQLNSPNSVAIDSNGLVYISDTGDNRVRMIDASGNIQPYAFNGVVAFGPNSISALQSSYSTPEYIVMDARNNMFVSGSSLYYVIQRIDQPTGTVMSVAGKYGIPTAFGYSGDGTAALGASINNYGASLDSQENLYIADGGNNRIRVVNVVPNADLSTIKLTFPPTPIGVPSQPMPFTDKDTGSDDLIISNTYTTGPFAYQNPLPCGDLIAPSLKCQWTVVFTPTTYGRQTGQAHIEDNAAGYPDQKLSMSGSGPDYTIAAQPSSLTISPGKNGNSTITLTPEAGFNQTVALSCSGLPSGTTCSFNPTQLILDGQDQASSNLSVLVGSNTQPGQYTLTVQGSSVTNNSTTITLTVP